MEGSANITNYVKVENLPPYYNRGQKLECDFSSVGDVQDVTAVDPTTAILFFLRHNGAENAAFAMDNSTLGGNIIRVSLYFNSAELKSTSDPALYQVLGQFTEVWSPTENEAPDKCAICQCELGVYAAGTYDKLDPSSRCLSLARCNHTFHQLCLEQLLSSSTTTYLECPTCKRVHSVMQGTMPTSGTIQHRLTSQQLPGHEGFGCLEVAFMFSEGVQGPEHPNPGQAYHPYGFPRTAFLPDSPNGLKMLHGLYLAWDLRVLFTVGTSITTGQQNAVIWNNINLKTFATSSEFPEHSYPDGNHLRELAEDLEIHGITQAEISSHMQQYPDLRQRGRLPSVQALGATVNVGGLGSNSSKLSKLSGRKRYRVEEYTGDGDRHDWDEDRRVRYKESKSSGHSGSVKSSGRKDEGSGWGHRGRKEGERSVGTRGTLAPQGGGNEERGGWAGVGSGRRGTQRGEVSRGCRDSTHEFRATNKPSRNIFFFGGGNA